MTEHGLKWVNRVSSGGIEPISLTSSGHVLYVLNENSGTIVGFRFSGRGGLWPIASQSLSTTGPSSMQPIPSAESPSVMVGQLTVFSTSAGRGR